MAVDSSDPAAVWSALIDAIGQRAFAWLRYLEIAQIESDRVVLRPVPGHREVMGFCTDQRLEHIANHLYPILARRVRVVVHKPESATGDAPASDQPGTNVTAPRSAQRREAMNLPLVQRVLEAFPDATLLDVREDIDVPSPADEGEDAAQQEEQ